jgi:DNA (cytosine-5)-methyltransferase 1
VSDKEQHEVRTHIDLFSGLGGFALASRANGIRTVQFVEIDQRCRDFLAKAWPGVAIHDDIKTFRWGVADAAESGRQHRAQVAGVDGQVGREGQRGGESSVQSAQVWLLTAGVPCQPASRAGKQRGASDHRWLWPDALRCLEEIRPAWAIYENPHGLGDVGLAGILAQVEAQGYAVRVFSLGACAVGAPHRRMRYWIVCKRIVADDSGDNIRNDTEQGAGGAGSERGRESYRSGSVQVGVDACNGDVADAGESGREGADAEPGADGLRAEHRQGDVADNECLRREAGRAIHDPEVQGGQSRPEVDGLSQQFWSRFVWLPCADGKIRRAPDDSFGLVDGLHRSVLGALGNSIVPQVAGEIIRCIIESESLT